MPILVEATAVTGRYPQVQFVDKPDSSATVRFDFNEAGAWADEDIWPGHDGFSLGAPTLEGEPDGIGTEYGFRQISFSLVVWGTAASAAPTMSALAKELQRQTNWLRYQHTAGSLPVWFKTYRSAPGAIDYQQVISADDAAEDAWGVAVSLDADPFALGQRVSLPNVTVANDPAAASHPVSVTLPTIAGDAPAPLTVGVYPSASSVCRPMVSVAPVSASFAGPVVWQSSNFTGYTDVGADTSSTAYSGGSYKPITFATDTSFTERATWSAITSPPAGKYKILGRFGRSDTSSQFDVGIVMNAYYSGPTVRLSGTSDAAWATWVDLGDFDLPPGSNSVAPTGLSIATYENTRADLHAGRVSGTGELRFDCLIAVPLTLVDMEPATTLFSQLDKGVVGADGYGYTHYIDGETEGTALLGFTNVLGLPSSNLVAAQNGVPLSGSFPVLRPGETNVLTLLLHVDEVAQPKPLLGYHDNTDDIAVTTTLWNMSYQPRWLYLASA